MRNLQLEALLLSGRTGLRRRLATALRRSALAGLSWNFLAHGPFRGCLGETGTFLRSL